MPQVAQKLTRAQRCQQTRQRNKARKSARIGLRSETGNYKKGEKRPDCASSQLKCWPL